MVQERAQVSAVGKHPDWNPTPSPTLPLCLTQQPAPASGLCAHERVGVCAGASVCRCECVCVQVHKHVRDVGIRGT